jgi:hypothetical protein
LLEITRAIDHAIYNLYLYIILMASIYRLIHTAAVDNACEVTILLISLVVDPGKRNMISNMCMEVI